MIQLFNIPNHTIDTSRFSNLLHDKIVTDFEQRFADYVGAKYAVAVSSATVGISLVLFQEYEEVQIPSILPAVVANALIVVDSSVSFVDNTQWVGHSYALHKWSDCMFIDSAQDVRRGSYAHQKLNDKDLMLFSFYPTKPVSGCDGGMIVSDDKESIERLRILAYNGMTIHENNWDRVQTTVGFKAYMSSIQAYIANQNLLALDLKKERLWKVRETYNKAFNIYNTSDHLYRVEVKDNIAFLNKAKQEGIQCGIHYKALHLEKVFQGNDSGPLPKSEHAAKTMVSIPFHEKLTMDEINKVIKFVHANK